MNEYKQLASVVVKYVFVDKAQSSLLLHASERLSENFEILKPINNKRIKRWDTLGTAIKMLAGNPDATDLRILNQTMNDLINENNVQVNINNKINSKLEQITNITNVVLAKNKSMSKTIDLIILMTNLNELNAVLEQIHKMIANTKLGFVSPQFISITEMNVIKDLLISQGIRINFVEEALNYITPKLVVKKNELIYMLNIPKLSKNIFSILRVQPLINNGEMIITTVKYVLFHENEMYETRNNIDFIQNLENLRDLTTDKCLKPILTGGNSQCNYTTISNQPDTIMLSSSSVLINNVHVGINSNCGPQNRSLQGNYLIFFQNCSVWINDQQFSSVELFIKHKPMFGAWQNLNITKSILLHQPDIKAIQLENLENRKKLDHVYLKQYHLTITMYSLFAGFSIITIIFILIVYCKLHKYLI